MMLTAVAQSSGQSWERLGPAGGMVLSLGVDSAGTVYLGTSDGHIFASEDRGARWELRGRVGTRTDAVITGLAADPRAPGKVFAALWFRAAGAGGGVFRSGDGGRTWQPSGLQGEAVRALEFSPSQPETIVAGTRSGVFRSRDTGTTWERISPPGDPELRNVDSIAVDPAQPDVIYAGTYHLPWKTADGGKTWKSIAAGLIDDSDVMSLRVDAGNPARVYLSACSGIYRSDNHGEQWTKLQGIPYAARRTQAIVQDPASPSTLYAATTEGLWVTRDAGESWQRATPANWVVNGAVVLPAKESIAARVLLGTEAQGVLVSDDSGKNFASSNFGFTHSVVKLLVGDTRDAKHLLALFPRRAAELNESRDGGKSWSPMPADAAAGTRTGAWNIDRIERVYSSPWGWIARLADGSLWNYSEQVHSWARWNTATAVPAQRGDKRAMKSSSARKPVGVAGAALAFSSESAIVPVAQGVVRCTPAGTCTELAAFLRVPSPSAIWVSSDGNSLALVSAEKFGVSKDGGRSAAWRDLPPGVGNVNWLAADSPQFSELYLGTERGLYLSTDAGAHWALVREGLPAASIGPGLSTSRGFVVTLEQGGIYYSSVGSRTWERVDTDAERGRINGLAETQTGAVLLASQSEGILEWRIPKPKP